MAWLDEFGDIQREESGRIVFDGAMPPIPFRVGALDAGAIRRAPGKRMGSGAQEDWIRRKTSKIHRCTLVNVRERDERDQ